MGAMIEQHNAELTAHWQAIGLKDGDNWSRTVGDYYNCIYYPDILQSLLKQGFKLDK